MLDTGCCTAPSTPLSHRNHQSHQSSGFVNRNTRPLPTARRTTDTAPVVPERSRRANCSCQLFLPPTPLSHRSQQPPHGAFDSAQSPEPSIPTSLSVALTKIPDHCLPSDEPPILPLWSLSEAEVLRSPSGVEGPTAPASFLKATLPLVFSPFTSSLKYSCPQILTASLCMRA